MIELFCKIHSNEVVTNSMRKGILTPVYKETGGKNNLRNWRSISLLNVDYKIVSRFMADRLSQVIREIVSENPRYFRHYIYNEEFDAHD